MSSKQKFKLGYPLLISGLSIATPIHAANEIEGSLLELSPDVLTNIPLTIASGTAKTVSQSAAVTSVITAEQIAAMGATDLHEVLETVPGVHVTIQPVTNDFSYSMRGIANTANNEILLMMNGMRFTSPYQGTHMLGMVIPVEDIQRIEVIRGPGSALYGADAFAGVINIITKKASDIDGTNIGARGGNADTTSAWGQHGGHWLGWDVATSLQYAHNGVNPDRIIQSDAQTQIDTILGTHASLAPGPMQTQNERWDGHLNLQRKHWDLGFWAFNDDGGTRAGSVGALDNKGSLAGSNYLADIRYSTEDDIKDWEIQAHASFLHTDVRADGVAFPSGAVLPIGADGNPTSNPAVIRGFMRFPDGARQVAGLKNTVPSFELTNIYKGFDDHILRFIAGYRYEEFNKSEFRNFGVGVIDSTRLLPPPAINVAGDMKNITDQNLLFLSDHHRDIVSAAIQDEWQLAKDWHLTTGLRYDHYSDFGNTWNPRAALVWDINPKLTSKLLYGQAYRAPSFLEQFQQNSPTFTGTPGLKPETIETTELAFDYRPLKELRTAVNLYYYEIHDLIGGAVSSQGAGLNTSNLNGQSAYGSEFEWDWRFLENWNLRGNYAWQYATNNDTGRRVADVPEHHVYSALAWNFMPKWQIQTQVNWIGHRLSDPGDTRILKDYATLDLTLNAKRLMGHLNLTASVRNLFDSHGQEPGSTAFSPNNLPIAPQTFYFEASVHF